MPYVYGVFCEACQMPYITSTLIELYASKIRAISEADHLNKNNSDPLKEDDYGPLSGCRYIVRELTITKED